MLISWKPNPRKYTHPSWCTNIARYLPFATLGRDPMLTPAWVPLHALLMLNLSPSPSLSLALGASNWKRSRGLAEFRFFANPPLGEAHMVPITSYTGFSDCLSLSPHYPSPLDWPVREFMLLTTRCTVPACHRGLEMLSPTLCVYGYLENIP